MGGILLHHTLTPEGQLDYTVVSLTASTLVLRDARGLVVRFQRAGAASPAAGNPLSGTWDSRSQPGHALVVDDTAWQLMNGTTLEDQGTYTVEGDTFTARSRVTGAVESYKFGLEGDVLTLQTKAGQVWVLERRP